MTPPASLREFKPEVGLVLGSGWGSLGEHLEGAFSVPYESVPGLPVPKVPGHAGRFVAGRLGGRRVVAACGRAHIYEGWTAREATAHVRLLAAAGIRMLLVCNAAGAVNPAFEPGTWMLITDHLNLSGQSPLTGTPHFLDMRGAYSPRLGEVFDKAARESGWRLERGVYACVPGPQFETPAEIRMLRAAGADAVGMSTVHEVIQARALGIETAGFSAISNRAADVAGGELSHDEVLKIAAEAALRFRLLLERALRALPGSPDG